MNKLRKGDQVTVLTGRDKGKRVPSPVGSMPTIWWSKA